jgi:hypothetical protein
VLVLVLDPGRWVEHEDEHEHGDGDEDGDEDGDGYAAAGPVLPEAADVTLRSGEAREVRTVHGQKMIAAMRSHDQ